MRRRLNNIIAAALIVGMAGAGLVLTARTARADPHAMFYTAIGQQQLFYNVLAALDQADYVETQFSREELVKARGEEEATPPFKDEEFPLTEATKVGQDVTSETDPGIADILTRLITLEGTDLYDDQLVREFGAESGRRNATSELLRALCDYGLGWEDCEFDTTGMTPKQIAEVEDYRRWAIVREPLQWAAMPFVEGVLGAFNSGLDDKLRYDRLNNTDGLKQVWPRAYSADIHKWRNSVKGNEKQEELLEELLVGAASDYVFLNKVEYPYKDIGFKKDGSLCFAPYGVCDEDPTAEELTELANQVIIAPLKVREIAEEAAARVALQQAIIENEGLKADVTLKSYPPKVGGLSPYGELGYLVENPVAVKAAEVYSLPNALAMLDTSQQASSLAGLDEPGSVQLVERSGSSGPTCKCSASDPGELPLCPVGDPQCLPGGVSGLQSSSEQVLGTLDLFDTGKYPRYDKPKEPTSPSGNIIAGHLEQGAVHALRVLTAGNFRWTTGVPMCGYTCY